MRQQLRNITLDDKYQVESGTVFLNGAQALGRLPMLQKRIDEIAGLNTAGFISGYRGSPLGHLDMTLWRIQDKLAENNVVFQPGINEDLAATAVSGTQQLDLLPDPACEGVFALWYGKGPGVDRSMDALKHGNFAGAHPNGGVLLVYGDDHPGKSSTVSHQSEQALAAQLIPSLYPASARELFRFGILGWAMSRFSGAWVGLKTVNDTIEQTATCQISPDDFEVVLPSVHGNANVHNCGSLTDRLENERIAFEDRLARVQSFVRVNQLDEVIIDPGTRRLGIVTSGKSTMDVLQGLELLGIDQESTGRYGVAVYKVGCIWPLEPVNAMAFATGLDEVLVVEEKKPFLEQQFASLLINQANRPALSGKRTPNGVHQLSSVSPLVPDEIALVIASRLEELGLADSALRHKSKLLKAQTANPPYSGSARSPFFCSGCPHNRSTRIPEGSHAMVGTGCATMEVFFRPERIVPAQMGGEGANWLGLAPFTNTAHIFQNLGDGTYYHSGLMSIRAAVAAKANITFKILYNDAVAMTGGQPVDGPLSPADIAAQVLGEHVKRCVIVAENPDLYRTVRLPPGVDVFHRDDLDRVQRELRKIEGCTVLIYEQTCAAEKRRRRKRGLMPDPDERLFIYDPVCEGCGDCSSQSNCVSIQPLETAFGRKRKIDQFSCNKDYSCNHGFCPSFVTVRGGKPRRGSQVLADNEALSQIPFPAVAGHTGQSYDVMIAGIGGTGVVTIGAVLGMAAHLEHRACSVFDMTGLAQKNGAVYSHLKVAADDVEIRTAAVRASGADLVLGFDLVAATGVESFRTVDSECTAFVGDSRVTPLPTFQVNQDALVDEESLVKHIRLHLDNTRVHLLDARGIASRVCGDSIMSNFLLLGYAAQLGLLPVSVVAIKRAIELNGVAVDSNSQAFDVGRLAAHNFSALERLMSGTDKVDAGVPESLDEVVEHRAAHLKEYQDAAYADRYLDAVHRIGEVEERLAPGCRGLQGAVARNYSRLLAYKDEYEVARQYSSAEFLAAIDTEFEGDFTLSFNLAPPLLSRTDSMTGRPAKREFGQWMLPVFRLLARMRRLRGSAADIFGYTAERRQERRLIVDYESWMADVAERLTPANHALALELLQVPESIRGFGPVKLENIATAMSRARELRAGLID